eukprot:scaffold15089_cov69-Phaeocystis_antarctica.AAC.1
MPPAGTSDEVEVIYGELARSRVSLVIFGTTSMGRCTGVAAERQARGLGTGTSDPRRRPEGDQGR